MQVSVELCDLPPKAIRFRHRCLEGALFIVRDRGVSHIGESASEIVPELSCHEVRPLALLASKFLCDMGERDDPRFLDQLAIDALTANPSHGVLILYEPEHQRAAIPFQRPFVMNLHGAGSLSGALTGTQPHSDATAWLNACLVSEPDRLRSSSLAALDHLEVRTA
jgi:hypothetical protein